MLKTTSFRRFTKTTKVIKASIAAIATLALLAGCATQPLPAGAAREDVIARYGKPTAVVVPVAQWLRLQQHRQPSLKEFLLTPEPRFELETPARGKWLDRTPPAFED